MDEDEEIYDDAVSVQKVIKPSYPSGVNNLKSMFENKPVMLPKPVPGAKPVPMAKPVGIQTQNGMTTEKRKSNLIIPNAFKTDDNKNNGTTSPTSPKPNTLVIPKTGTESTVRAVSPLNSQSEMNKTPGEASKVSSSEKPKQKEVTREKIVPPTSKTSSVHELAANLNLKNVLKPVPKLSDKPTEIKITPKVKKPINENDAAQVVMRKQNQHQQQKHQSRKSFLRHDGKKFLLVELLTINSQVDIIAPAKPESLTIELDMESLKMDFQAEKSSQESSNSGNVEEVEEETYDDVDNVVRGQKSTVSYIEELTEEEEKQWHEENDFPPPPPGKFTAAIPQSFNIVKELQNEVGHDETYDDALSKIADTATGDEESQEMYEVLPEVPAVTPTSSDSSGDSITLTSQSEKSVADEDMTSLKGKEKDKKSKDKEKDKEKAKEKEKAKDKEPDKKRKKIESNNNKILKELKMKSDDLCKAVGKGKVKENNPGGKNNSLAVTKGLLITIIRMDLKDKKYKGKWLVQTEENEVGFVDSQNIEVQTGLIRSMMQGKVVEPNVNQIDGEAYEDVPDAQAGKYQEEGGEEIYEFVED